MELYPILTGYFRLDGGAMFGIVPKVLWAKTNPPDEWNRIALAMRALLVIDGDNAILIDAGIGHKYDETFAKNYAIDHSQFTLDSELAKIGLTRKDITDVIVTHLHFDHGGGLVERDEHGQLKIAFPNARIWIQKRHLEWAMSPNLREKASFLKENIQPLLSHPRLQLPDGEFQFNDAIRILVVNGHTEGQQLPLIRFKNYQLLYAADLFPTHAHIPIPYVMAYDIRPLVTVEERSKLLPRIVEEEIVLFFEHDPEVECSLVTVDEKGRYVSGKRFPLRELT